MMMPATFIEKSKNINVIIETPKDSSCKYTYEPDGDLFKLGKILPEGLKFPLHFGFIPGTKGEDGDPLDVLVLLDEPTYPGCLIECKVVGAIKARQKERNKESVRNDRIIAAALVSLRYVEVNSLNDLDKYILKEITNFFITYNSMAKKIFTPLGNVNAPKTIRLIEKSMDNGTTDT